MLRRSFHFGSRVSSRTAAYRRPLAFRRALGLSALLALCLALGLRLPEHASPAMPEAVAAAQFGALPLSFVANGGQADASADYVARGDNVSVLFGSEAISFRFAEPPAAAADCPKVMGRGMCLATLNLPLRPDPLASMRPGERAGDAERGTVDAVAVRFVEGRPGVRPVAEADTGGIFSLFRGPKSEWIRGLPIYGRLVYRDVWPGVDVEYSGSQFQLKQTFRVHPGADPSKIRLAWQGTSGLRLDEAGRLIVGTAAGNITDDAPVAWQEVGGKQVPVKAAYRLARSDETAASYGFELGTYDPGQTLVLDPAMLVYAGFIGGSGEDRGLGIALDDAGAAYITGNNADAAYVVKISPDGTKVEYIGIIAGTGKVSGFDVDVDPTGAAYVTGGTYARENTFPVNVGPDLTFNGSTVDAYVAKISPDGKDLVYCGYLGGGAVEFGEGLVVDEDGNAYMTGLVESSEATFPVKVGPDLTQNGKWDAYVAKLKPVPDAENPVDNYEWIGFIGGEGQDVAVTPNYWSSGHIGIDRQRNVYISGQTNSSEATFPDGDGFGDMPSPDRTYNGDWDAYVAKVRADGKGLVYAGYIGGAGLDEGKGMAIDASGAAYMTGHTNSREDTFPVTVGPDLTYNGLLDGFVAKIRPDGSGLVYCGYMGGDDDDSGQAVHLGPDGALYVAGWAESAEITFPAVGGPDRTHNGPEGLDDDAAEFDALIGRLKSDVSSPDPRQNWDYLGYVGGGKADAAFWLDVDAKGAAVIAGDTNSDAATFPDGSGMRDVTGFGKAPHGLGDAFAVKVTWQGRPPGLAHLPWAGFYGDFTSIHPVAFEPTPANTARAIPPKTATPLPSPTRLPTPVIAVPEGEEVVFADDFSDPNSGWYGPDQGGGKLRYIDGTLEVAAKDPDGFYAGLAPGVTYKSGALEFTMARTEDDDTIIGLGLGPASGTIYLYFFDNGNFVLTHRFADQIRLLSPVQSSPFLELGTKSNRIRVERDGRHLDLYANGHLILSADDPVLAEPGIVALMLLGSADHPSRVRFDDVLVTRWTGAHVAPTPLPPTPTPPPTPTRAPRVLLEDDFSRSTSGWPTGENANSRARYVDGEYELSLLAANRFLGAPAPGVNCDDCTIEVTGKFASSTSIIGAMGIVMGLGLDPNSQLTIELRNAGNYAIERLDNGTWSDVVPATSTTLIKTDGPNKIRAVRSGGKLSVFVNDQPLRQVTIPDLSVAGIAGLLALGGPEANFTVRYDNFLAKENDPFAAAGLFAERSVGGPDGFVNAAHPGVGLDALRSWLREASKESGR